MVSCQFAVLDTTTSNKMDSVIVRVVQSNFNGSKFLGPWKFVREMGSSSQ